MKSHPYSEADDERTCGISGILANQERRQERLKAAAPQMLEALKKAYTCMSIPDDIRDLIRDAILAATRENPVAVTNKVPE
jgi:hypothetical protein